MEQPNHVYHDEGYKNRRWVFPSYNFSISVFWSPYLVQAAIFEDMNGVSTSEVQLHLDQLDKKWVDQFQNLNYMIISTGKWFLKDTIYYENNTVVGCHSCSNQNITKLGFDYAYRKTLSFIFNFIVASKHKGMIFFRTATPDHFENGEWNTGGVCPKTAPVKEGELEFQDLQSILHNIELEEFAEAEKKAQENGVNLKLLDLAKISLTRPDGHPGPYRFFHPLADGQSAASVQNDCLHWCLPGPIDSWNDVIMEMMVNS